MKRYPRSSSRRNSRTAALLLIYCVSISLLVISNHPVVNAASHKETLSKDRNAILSYSSLLGPDLSSNPTPSPTSVPSPTPEPSPSPEPMPTMTPTTVPTPSQSVPALPNLDGLRNVEPEEPEVPDVVPSTRCSPGQPDCDPATGNPVPPAQAFLREHGRPVHSGFNPMHQRLPLPQDQMLAWTSNQFSTPFFKDGASREAADTSAGTNAFFSFFEPVTGGSYDDFVMARLDPDNRTGSGGEDILSRNFNWSLPLVGMTGRAGLNLGLSLSYNSLVWTRSGNYITYDADNGFPTPGFHLGFPVVYGLHYNSQTGTNGYLMLMPSGGRVELRQVGSSNVYEAADSSYLQLTENEDGSLLVRSTDGTQLLYESTANGFRCSQVKDRNGNYLSIVNNGKGRLESVTDTLGRVFNFNYDENNNLTSISQTRSDGEYTWVTFGYTNLTPQTNFTGLTLIGIQNGTALPVLTQVGLRDGTYFKFSYSSWGQVYKITNYAADSNNDSHPLNYVSYNLPLTSGTAQTDCPRFTQRKDWAENWNSGNEAVTNYAVPSTQTWTMPGGGQQTGTFCQIQTPDGVYQNVYLHSTGWDEGMPVLVNTYDSQVALQRQATTSYTQDNTGVSYMLNPRVTEANVFDPAGNHKRTAISYSSSYGLPTEVREYAANATSVIRTTQTDYNLNSNYTSRRLIGLVSQKRVYDTANGNTLVSKVDFVYDENGEYLVQQGSPIQHDTDNYGSSFTWRGNLTKVKRWDVINTSAFAETKTGYNTTGLPIFTRDPLQTSNTQANIIYTDSFSDSENRDTYAYPTETTIKDTVGTSSTLVMISLNKTQYNFDTGTVTRTEGPPPAGQSQGAIVTSAFDSADRLYLTTNAVNSGYVYIIYPTSSNVVQTYTTIQSTQSATVSAKLLDGAGRVRATAADHPGSTGGYVGQIFVFDIMGRKSATSNPTEIYGSWQPAGDDATTGWVYSYQTYDWKSRPRVTTNQDSSTKEATYGGCGCAGGEIVTVRDEVNRYSKVYHDVLGRVIKSEELNLDQSVFRTTTNIYNASDQVTSASVQQGSSGAAQTSTMTYDGYGRLSTSHEPIQDANTVTSITYNADDSVATTTDNRGVVATLAYNNRHLTTSVSYPNTAPTGVHETAAASFTFDAAGNRTSMTDGMGSVSYQYNSLSRLTSEARTFTALSATYTLAYEYNLAGQVTSITEPGNVQVGYTRDITGKLTAVTGTGYASGIDYVSEIKYRATRALKSITYQNGVQATLSYTNRLLPSNYKLASQNTQNLTPMDIDYFNSADGQIRNSTNKRVATLDRAFKYDHAGRLSEAYTGSEARSWVQTGSIGTTVDGPYRQTYTMDAWNNMTTKWGRSFLGSAQHTQTVSYTYDQTTGRNNAWTYDANGNILSADDSGTGYDEAGKPYAVGGGGGVMAQFEFDGTGQKAKRTSDFDLSVPTQTYYLYSTVLGQTLKEIGGVSGDTGYVYADGELVATRSSGLVFWQHKDPTLRSMQTTNADGLVSGQEELDPNDVTVFNPSDPTHHHGPGDGGGNNGPGGIEARVANLMDLSLCDVGEMTVLCGVAEGIKEQISGLGERMEDHWNGITTWDVTVTAEWSDGSITYGIHEKGGLFQFKEQDVEDDELIPEDFTEHNAYLFAQGLALELRPAMNPHSLNQSQQLEQSLTDTQKEIVKDVVGTAINYLNRFSDCAKYVAANSMDPAGDLDRLQDSMKYFNGHQFSADERPAYAAVRGDIYGAGSGPKHIVLGYNFFYGSAEQQKARDFDISLKNALVMTILHEFKHITENRGHQHSDPNDSSEAWDRQIRKDCIK